MERNLSKLINSISNFINNFKNLRSKKYRKNRVTTEGTEQATEVVWSGGVRKCREETAAEGYPGAKGI